jgi:murein peptide amidase A
MNQFLSGRAGKKKLAAKRLGTLCTDWAFSHRLRRETGQSRFAHFWRFPPIRDMAKKMSSQNLGKSHLGRPIELRRFGTGPVPALFLAGSHGDEIEGLDCLARFLELLEQGKIAIPASLTLYICPDLNPDGTAANRRTNHRNVDVNRNFPTRDWSQDFHNTRYYPGASPASEPETRALIEALDKTKPRFIVSLHSYEKPMVNYNEQISAPLAEAMSKVCGLPAKSDIGYKTPGSFGTYAALERGIPTITLEILRDQKLEEVWQQHRPTLEAALAWGAQLK